MEEYDYTTPSHYKEIDVIREALALYEAFAYWFCRYVTGKKTLSNEKALHYHWLTSTKDVKLMKFAYHLFNEVSAKNGGLYLINNRDLEIKRSLGKLRDVDLDET